MHELRKFLALAAFAALLGPAPFPVAAHGAGAAAVGENDDFALRALDKVLEKWSPPAEASATATSIRLSLDRDGHLLSCRPVKASTSEALDRSACAAAKGAQPFGAPPYGLPVELYMAFWTGKATAGENRPAQAATQPAAQKKAAQAPDAAQQKYLATITRSLRESIYIPVQTARGTYTVRARIEVAADGRIKNSEISGTSGDAMLDKYVLQGIHRAGKVSPPPKGLSPWLELTFRLVRS